MFVLSTPVVGDELWGESPLAKSWRIAHNPTRELRVIKIEMQQRGVAGVLRAEGVSFSKECRFSPR